MRIVNRQNIALRKWSLATALLVLVVGFVYALNQSAGLFQLTEVTQVDFLNAQGINFQAVYDLAIALLLLIIPAALSWYGKNFVKSAENQKLIANISTLASEAVNYAEDIEKRGEREYAYNSLDLPENMARNPSPGFQKLCLASNWLVEELARLGVKRFGVEEAANWVAAKYQEQVGDLHTIHSVSTLADMAADLLGQLGRSGHIALPNNKLDSLALAQSIADWVADQRAAGPSEMALRRDMAMARIAPKSLTLARQRGRSTGRIAPELRLTLLGRQALEFAADLEQQGKLSMPEVDTARAWMIQQAQQEDIPATMEQIDKAITAAQESTNATSALSK